MITKLAIEYIVSDPEQRRGKPMIAGTGITVQNLADSLHNGLIPEQMADEFDLTLGQVHAALSYYHDHKADIDAAREDDATQASAQLQDLEQEGQAVSFEELKRRVDARRR